jgi:tRNA (adenine57-N1/adenine58-N1)-methyltransferase
VSADLSDELSAPGEVTSDEPAGARNRRGVFGVGDRVQLTDDKSRKHTVALVAGKQFHTHKGAIEHDALIGQPEGIVVVSTGGTPYVAFRPLLADFVLSMPRGATVVYPKDAAQIVAFADIFPGARVLEAGAGSGALSCSLLRAVGDAGLVISYERRPDFAEIAARNVEMFFSGTHPAWECRIGDVGTDPQPLPEVDRVVLDMLSPWEVLPAVTPALIPGGVLCGYVATTTQLSRLVEALRESGAFAEPSPWETMQRGWHVDGLAVRPDHRMVGHTGFLVTARKLAPGVTPPARRTRPSKGARPEPTTAADVANAELGAAGTAAESAAQAAGPPMTEPSGDVT